jgi:Transferase family
MCVHHALCDGAGANQFLACISRFVRGEGKPVSQPQWSRAELLGPRNPPHDHVSFDRAFTIDAEVVEQGTYCKQEKSVGVHCLVKEWFNVSDKCVEKFRNQLNEEAGFGVNFTTFEALTAYIWRARFQIFNPILKYNHISV